MQLRKKWKNDEYRVEGEKISQADRRSSEKVMIYSGISTINKQLNQGEESIKRSISAHARHTGQRRGREGRPVLPLNVCSRSGRRGAKDEESDVTTRFSLSLSRSMSNLFVDRVTIGSSGSKESNVVDVDNAIESSWTQLP